LANQNAIKLDAAGWVDAKAWKAATATQRKKYLNAVADAAKSLKRSELRRGIGVDGDALLPVKPSSRKDGADGKPLDPHYGQSRVIRWLRSTIGAASGTVTLWWSHGWGRILGYHAEGRVLGAPIRNVIGLSPASRRKLKQQARTIWGSITKPRWKPLLHKTPPPKPKPKPVPKPFVHKTKPKPTAAKGAPKVEFIGPGQKPKLVSKKIQVVIGGRNR
jgi:hypothetical protein